MYYCLTSVLNLTMSEVIENMNVEYTRTPICIDITAPCFTWQMSVISGEWPYTQTAYPVIEKTKKVLIALASIKITSDVSLGILYAGTPLKATTRYNWDVTV